MFVLLTLSQKQLISMYTPNLEIQSESLQVTPIIILYLCQSIIRGHYRGTIKAFGLQKKILVANITFNWVINIGLMYFLSIYYSFGIRGIWVSKFVSESGNSLYYLWLIHQCDWAEVALKAKNRISKNKK